jgi:DNA-binding NarL/FixJ family response regulator
MQPRNVVLLQSNSQIAQSLISALSNTFDSVQQVRSMGELRASIAKHRGGVAIVDLETASIPDVQQLSHDLPGACVVCTHRCADEEMWTAALNAGACDVCPSSDTRGILLAALRNTSVSQSAAA